MKGFYALHALRARHRALNNGESMAEMMADMLMEGRVFAPMPDTSKPVDLFMALLGSAFDFDLATTTWISEACTAIAHIQRGGEKNDHEFEGFLRRRLETYAARWIKAHEKEESEARDLCAVTRCMADPCS